MTKDEVKKLWMDSPESLRFLNNATKFYNLMMMYRCAIREIQTKLEVLDDEFSVENNRNPISFIKTRIKKPNSIYNKLQKMGHDFTTENIQTYLNDVAGVRIVCAFIDDIGWLLIFNTLIAGLITSFINAKLLEPITRLSKAMKEVSQGDFEQHLETNSRIAEVGESYQSFNVMTKELRATEVLQMDFVSNVSHEFKTPINAIEGYTMLLQGEELSQEQEEYVEKILFNTQRLSGLVGNILLLSKLENQNIPMKKTEYRLDEQIRQAFLSLETKWTEKEIGFQVELEEVKYTGNEGLFMHIWINLLDNAIKFSPAKGTIMMFLKQEKDSVMFILEDEGPGIEDDVKTRIFDKFYQADGSHKAEGNGLGLALVKRIVDSAGGTIKAENREYGGCRFVVELPIQKDEAI